MSSMTSYSQIPCRTKDATMTYDRSGKGTQGMGAHGNSEGWTDCGDPVSELGATLHRDHVAVGRLIDQLSSTDAVEARRALWEQVFTELSAHTDAEEQIVYSAVLRHGWALSEQVYTELSAHADTEELAYAPVLRECEMRSKVEDAIEEHDEIRRILLQLDAIDPRSEQFVAGIADLARAVDSHVRYEERKLLPLAEQLFEANTLAKMERDFVYRKRMLLEQVAANRSAA